MKNELPVILLAFANDPQNAAGGYLRQLPLEINGLKAIFDRAQDAGLCEVEILTNTTIEQLIGAFQKPKYRGRIAVFHYSGHANSFDLLLENEKNRPQRAHSEGLLPFLAAQPGLQLVFLNGCFSWQQASELSQRGVPVVIGTVKAVDDAVATQLSQAFYRGLTAGLGIGAAWKEACWALTTQAGGTNKSIFYQRSHTSAAKAAGTVARGANLDETGDDRFPWDIRYKEGAEEVANWNLPDAVANPLFGLPPLPARYTPPEPPPYRFLRRFEQTDAAIFFGRGRYIRDLYHRLNSPQTSPVLLFVKVRRHLRRLSDNRRWSTALASRAARTSASPYVPSPASGLAVSRRNCCMSLRSCRRPISSMAEPAFSTISLSPWSSSV